MWVLKSIGTGLLAVLAALVACISGILVYAVVVSAKHPEHAGGVGWDVVSLVHQKPPISIAFFVSVAGMFALGFLLGRRWFAPH
jgi:hypothetical protein